MELEISEALLGWQVTNSYPPLRDFDLNETEKKLAAKLLVGYFNAARLNKQVELETLLRRNCEANLNPISMQSFRKIVATCHAVTRGVGPLEALLNEDVEEVLLTIGKARVFRRNQGWADAGLEITTQAFLLHIINKLATACGRRLSVEQPVLNAFLPNGNRIHAVSPPVSDNLHVSIRKLREVPFTLEDLVDGEVLSRSAAVFLKEKIASSSALIAGNTGSGKTTTLNALLSLLPQTDRFVFVEDVSEITLPSHENKARLLADKNTPLSQLVGESLRMRPDRLVVSEIRNEVEVNAFANALLSGGGKTCYSTFHGQSAQEALRRLRLLGFKKADLDSIGLIVVQKRIDDKKTGREKRKITEIATVKNGEAKLVSL